MLNEFIGFLNGEVGKSGYCWSAQGQKGTYSELRAFIKAHETSASNIRRALAYLDKLEAAGVTEPQLFDCSGLGMYYLYNLKGILTSDLSSRGMYAYCRKIPKSGLKKGDWVFKYSYTQFKIVHVGYVVDEALNVVECKGRDDGVVKRPLSMGGWNRFGRPPCFEAEITAITAPIFVSTVALTRNLKLEYTATGSVNMRKGGGTSFTKICTLSQGDKVTYIGMTGSWMKVYYKGEIGYIYASYLSRNSYMQGDDVKAVQKALGFSAEDQDGAYGRQTAEAVVRFQNAQGLKADGIAGQDTWRRLMK